MRAFYEKASFLFGNVTAVLSVSGVFFVLRLGLSFSVQALHFSFQSRKPARSHAGIVFAQYLSFADNAFHSTCNLLDMIGESASGNYDRFFRYFTPLSNIRFHVVFFFHLKLKPIVSVPINQLLWHMWY